MNFVLLIITISFDDLDKHRKISIVHGKKTKAVTFIFSIHLTNKSHNHFKEKRKILYNFLRKSYEKERFKGWINSC